MALLWPNTSETKITNFEFDIIVISRKDYTKKRKIRAVNEIFKNKTCTYNIIYETDSQSLYTVYDDVSKKSITP